jgi:hypothetical protein
MDFPTKCSRPDPVTAVPSGGGDGPVRLVDVHAANNTNVRRGPGVHLRWEFQDAQGRPHRLDGPAVGWADGSVSYWVHGVRHRTGGLPAVVYADGGTEFWVGGERTTRSRTVA